MAEDTDFLRPFVRTATREIWPNLRRFLRFESFFHGVSLRWERKGPI